MSEVFEPSNEENTKGYNKITKQDSNTQSINNIESNEKELYISRLIHHKTKLIKYLIFQLLTLLVDIFCSIAYKYLFNNKFNLFSIIYFYFGLLLCYVNIKIHINHLKILILIHIDQLKEIF